MNNRKVAAQFKLLGELMELHGENPFKTKSYANAYNVIRRLPNETLDLPKEQLITINGIGKTIADKIIELQEKGKIAALEEYKSLTPPGVVQMLGIKGMGVKKVLAIWKELGVESPGELLHACSENRLAQLKGFGQKTQKELEEKLTYFLDSQGKYLYGHIIHEAEDLLALLQDKLPNVRIAFTGDIARKMPEVEGISLLTDSDGSAIKNIIQQVEYGEYREEEGYFYQGTKCHIYTSPPDQFNNMLWHNNADISFLSAFKDRYPDIDLSQSVEAIFAAANMHPIPSECRESARSLLYMEDNKLKDLISLSDIKGVIHNHSTYSDGVNTVREMAEACRELGYEYLVMSDHSKSAFYANGLSEERCLQQMDEIDRLNQEWSDFKIYKSIECDILNDGSLDYSDEFLESFDLVIASIHANLKMDVDKANARLIRAIQHPSTRILGHMTGRLLLSREGYPIDHGLIIDACAEYDVVIELNANPYRLDMDWHWIEYAVDKGVLIAINPDAHSVAGIRDIAHGVTAARKGLLLKNECLNTKSRAEFDQWLNKK